MIDTEEFDYLEFHEEEYHAGKKCDCGKDKPKPEGLRFAGDEVYGYGDWTG